MTVGLLSPVARQREFSGVGVTLPGAKLTTYAAGSTTPLQTYSASDLAIGHENANPIVADAGGLFGPIYFLFGRSYKLVLTDADDTPIWTQDNVTVSGVADATFDVTAYGATPGGVVDCLAAFQLAVAAAIAAGGGVIYVPLGTWRLSAQLSVRDSYVSFRGQGAGSILQFDDVAGVSAFALDFRPATNAETTSSLLASNVAIGDRSVVVAAGEGVNFTAGAWVRLYDGDTNTGNYLSYIESISTADTLTLRDAAPCALLVASSATISTRATAARLLYGVSIQDLTVKCATAAPTTLSSLIGIQYAIAPIVQNVYTSGCRVAGVYYGYCIDGRIVSCNLTNGILTGGEGVALASSANVAIANCVVRHCSFGIVVSKSPHVSVTGCQVHGRQSDSGSVTGRGIKFSEGSNFGSINGNIVSDPYFFGIYCQDSSHCAVTGNTILSTGEPADITENGIQLGGFLVDGSVHGVVSGNTIRSCKGYGIAVNATVSGAARDWFALVANNNITDCKSGAVLVYGCSKVSVLGNVIFQDPATLYLGGAIIVDGGTPAPGQCLIQGNSIFSLADAPLVGIDTSAGAGTSIVTNNLLGTGVTQTLHASDRRDPTFKPPYSSDGNIVSTVADTNPTVAWTKTIPGGTLGSAIASLVQGFRVFARFSTAANANNKTIALTLGTATVTHTWASNQETIYIEAVVLSFAHNHLIIYGTMHSGTADGNVIMRRDFFASSTDEWNNDQPFTLTMTNGVASAGDINFQLALLEFFGVPRDSSLFL